MKKADAEKLLIEHIKKIGIEQWSVMQGEGVSKNNEYYCFFLKNGEQRFWTNPSEELKKLLPQGR